MSNILNIRLLFPVSFWIVILTPSTSRLGVGVKSKRVVIPANNSYDIRYYNAMIAIDGLNGACWGIGIFGKNYTDVNWLIPKVVEISVNRDTYSSVTKVVNNSTSDVKLYVIMFDDGGY